MNERIDVLALEATDSKGGLDRHKFAKLIIRDVEKVIWQSEPQKFSIIFSVKKHFGVEL